jgi:acetolactate synthase-1/2/3 large subunit
MTTVGGVIAAAIRAQGVRHVFCVPGESYLGLLDAFNDVPEVRLVTTRHEEGAGLMAEAGAKVSGRPGVAMVTRGPGIAHLSMALHVAAQDSTPLLAFVGQVPTGVQGREAFQEVDLVGLGRLLGKDAVEIRDGARAGELVQRAFHLAQTGRPGPVVVSVPEDVGLSPAPAVGVGPAQAPRPGPAEEAVERAVRLITAADRVAILAGGGAAGAPARAALVALAEAIGASVFAAWRRFDVFPNDHPLYAGNVPWIPARLQAPLREADLLLAVGTRLGDFTSFRYELPGPGQRLVHVDAAAESMATTRPPEVGIVSDASLALERLGAALQEADRSRVERRRRWAEAAHAEYLGATTPRPVDHYPGRVDLEAACHSLREALPASAITVTDAGAFSTFVHRFLWWREPATFVGTTSGAMGYGVPGAIGAKLARPDRLVVALTGDGGFAMTMAEVLTAVRCGLDGLIVVVFDNGSYGTIRRHQRLRFPAREIGVDLGPIDVPTLARAFGARGLCARSNGEFAAALREATAGPGVTLLQAMVDPEQLDAWAD